jgi:hypothetical protein
MERIKNVRLGVGVGEETHREVRRETKKDMQFARLRAA